MIEDVLVHFSEAVPVFTRVACQRASANKRYPSQRQHTIGTSIMYMASHYEHMVHN